jgi:hypothetical protein
MRLKSNGGTMVVTKKAEISGYHAHVWYNKNAIANILALRNVIKQYPVTYDSDDKMFVVHRESVGKTNMEFRMHESGIHYYDPRNNESHLDDDEHLDDAEIPGVNAAAIPGVVYAAAIPGVASVKLPGVDDEVAANEIYDLDEPTTEIVCDDNLNAPADAQPAKPQGAVATKDGHNRNIVAAKEDGSDRNVEATNTVRNDVKATRRSAWIWTQTVTQLESHRVLNPDAHMFVIEDGYERAATKDGSEAATEVGHEAANE